MREPVIRARSAHNLSRKRIDPDALKVLYRLHNGGYKAHLVGGGVRDLLLEREPKDYDIATDAHPQEIKRLFRNARLIGRRFRLAHIVFGPKIVEVSTFRKKSEWTNEDSEDLLIRRDNTFGTAEEDALRRDFTVNGLFYDIATFAVIDYVGGLDDLDSEVIRSIGDPVIRFQEDPIRMMRAVKFSARLGFEIEPGARSAILSERWELPKAAAPRIVEEYFRLLRGGQARKSYQLLRELGILEVIFPRMEKFIVSPMEEVFENRLQLWEYLETLDEMHAEGREFSNSVLAGCLLVHPVRAETSARGLEGDDPRTIEELLAPLALEMHLPRRDTERLRAIIALQPRLQRPPEGRGRLATLASRSYFSDALDLFEIHARSCGLDTAVLDSWRELAASVPATRATGRRRRRRRPPRRAPEKKE